MLRYLDPETKKDPSIFWSLGDRPFFGFGACHILTGIFLSQSENHDFYGIWVKPHGGFKGNHVFATNGEWAFDYHGYSNVDRLCEHFWQNQILTNPGWDADKVAVDFDLLETKSLNERNMRGPDQYLKDPSVRAQTFIKRFATKRQELNV
jgi:hypothetical protein